MSLLFRCDWCMFVYQWPSMSHATALPDGWTRERGRFGYVLHKCKSCNEKER